MLDIQYKKYPKDGSMSKISKQICHFTLNRLTNEQRLQITEFFLSKLSIHHKEFSNKLIRMAILQSMENSTNTGY